MRSMNLVPGLMWTGLLVGTTAALAQPSGHGSGPPMPDQQFYLNCRLAGGEKPVTVEAHLQLTSPGMAADLDQVISLPDPLPPIRVKRYLPRATLEQEVTPDPGRRGEPAVQVSISGPTQTYSRWLIAGDPLRNRLTSFIGTWRYMAADDRDQRDQLFEQFRNELVRKPKLFVRAVGQSDWAELPAQPGASRSQDGLGCTIRVESFLPHFGMDNKTKKPVNQSDQLVNPAALVEIEHQGRSEQRWVFARFPDYGADKEGRLPFQVTLDCPQAKQGSAPDFMLLTIDRAAHELWTRHTGKTVAKSISLNKPSDVVDSQYAFQVTRFVPFGRLVERYQPTDNRGAVTALQIETVDATGSDATMWLELGKAAVLRTTEGPMTVVFSPRPGVSAGAHP